MSCGSELSIDISKGKEMTDFSTHLEVECLNSVHDEGQDRRDVQGRET